MSYFCLLTFILLVFWRPQEWLFPQLYGIPFLDMITYLSVLAMLLEFDTGRAKINWSRPQYKLYIGLFIAALMSHISHFYFAGLMANWATAFRICFFGILLFSSLNSANRMLWIVRVFVFMACFMAVHAILQQVRGFGFGGQEPILSWRPEIEVMVWRSKFFGIFEDPNDMGQMLATAMPFAFVIFKKRSVIGFAIGCAICWLLWLGIDAAWSRGSQVGMVVAAAVMVIQIFPARSFMGLLCVCVVGGLGMLPLTAQLLGAVEYERVDFWGQANWAFKSSPIFGVGLGQVREYIHRSRAVHNAFITCYAELGVFGYFFWFTLIFIALVGLAQTKKHLSKDNSPDTKYLYRLTCWGLAAFMGFLASSYFLSRAFIFPLFFMMSLFGAVPFLAREVSEDAEDMYIPGMRDCVVFGIPLSLASILYIYVSVLIMNALR